MNGTSFASNLAALAGVARSCAPSGHGLAGYAAVNVDAPRAMWLERQAITTKRFPRRPERPLT